MQPPGLGSVVGAGDARVNKKSPSQSGFCDGVQGQARRTQLRVPAPAGEAMGSERSVPVAKHLADGIEQRTPVSVLLTAGRNAARACLLTADAVVDHDGGESDAAEVGQRVLVVAGRDSAPLLESVEPALDAVAVSVHAGVESWWPPTC